MISSRQLAFDALLRVSADGAYSNLILDSLIGAAGMSAKEKSLASALVYGVLEKQITLDYQLSLYLDKPIKKLRPGVLAALRLGVYQLLFMSRIPASAAVNESVRLVRSNGCAFAAGLVNAVLRKVSVSGLRLPENDDKKRMLIEHSFPEEIYDLWSEQYGAEDAAGIMAACSGPAPLYIRVNTLRTTEDELKALLESEGVTAESGPIPDCLEIKGGADIERLKSYSLGLFHVQDVSSQLCARALCVKPGDTVIDLCSAPGGKAFTAAQFMHNEGRLICCDIYDQRLGLISGGAGRLGIDIVSVMRNDASVFNPDMPMADVVLCDVPCSGLGIIRRKPEIKYKNFGKFDKLSDLQYNILSAASRYVKPGGRLVYSTCALNKNENENNVDRFLASIDGFVPVPTAAEDLVDCRASGESLTFMPHLADTDGFFISAFERRA